MGAAAGALFFGALWLTLLRLPASPYPRRLFWASFVGRAALVLSAFCFLAATQRPLMLLTAVVAFWLSRGFLIRTLICERRVVR